LAPNCEDHVLRAPLSTTGMTFSLCCGSALAVCFLMLIGTLRKLIEIRKTKKIAFKGGRELIKNIIEKKLHTEIELLRKLFAGVTRLNLRYAIDR
jgi:hypothetical protein